MLKERVGELAQKQAWLEGMVQGIQIEMRLPKR